MESLISYNPMEFKQEKEKNQEKIESGFNKKISDLLALEKYVEVMRKKRKEIEQNRSLYFRKKLREKENQKNKKGVNPENKLNSTEIIEPTKNSNNNDETTLNINEDLNELFQHFKNLKEEIENSSLTNKRKEKLLQILHTKLNFLETLEDLSIMADDPNVQEKMDREKEKITEMLEREKLADKKIEQIRNLAKQYSPEDREEDSNNSLNQALSLISEITQDSEIKKEDLVIYLKDTDKKNDSITSFYEHLLKSITINNEGNLSVV